MKRSGFTLWKWLVSDAVLLILVGMVLGPVFSRARENTRNKIGCPRKLSTIALALAQYSQDWDKQLPRIVGSQQPTAAAPYGWADALFPYVNHRKSEFERSSCVFLCPSGPSDFPNEIRVPTSRSYTDYWFNSNLSGLALKNVSSAKQTITFGDGNGGADLTDARYNLSSLPAAWISNQNSPAYRHGGGANYAFLDGHVKWFKPESIVSGAATFTPK